MRNIPKEQAKEGQEESEYPDWMSEVTKRDIENFCIDACRDDVGSTDKFRNALIEMAKEKLRKHRDALRILWENKVFGNKLRQEEFEKTLTMDDNSIFWQAGEHCIGAMMYGGLLARKLGCNDEEISNVEKACLLHDAGKLQEIRLWKSGAVNAKDAIDLSAAHFKKQLENAGLSDVIPLADAIVLYSDGEVLEADSMSIEQKIVAYVDMMLDETAPNTIEKRLAEDAEHWREYYEQTLGRYEGESLKERFKRTGPSIEKEFATSLEAEIKPSEFPKYCRELLAEEVREYMDQGA
jgi:hypothetical protein